MLFERNIGLISEHQQTALTGASVLIAGLGGMGGVAAEVLVRMGLGNIRICDHDVFEASNCNRQLHSGAKSIGRFKADVLKEQFIDINSNLNIQAISDRVQLSNVDTLLEDMDIVINGMDDMYSSILLERRARQKRKTLVDAWLTPYASVFVMQAHEPHWEQTLGLPTYGVPIEELTDELCMEAVRKEVEYTFSHFSPYEIVGQAMVEDVLHGRRPRPSLAPVVWLSGVLMANEALKIVTGQKPTDHRGIFFNQYDYEICRGKF